MLNLPLSIAAQNGVSACFFFGGNLKKEVVTLLAFELRGHPLKGRVLPCDHDMPFFLVFWIVFDDTLHNFERIVVSHA